MDQAGRAPPTQQKNIIINFLTTYKKNKNKKKIHDYSYLLNIIKNNIFQNIGHLALPLAYDTIHASSSAYLQIRKYNMLVFGQHLISYSQTRSKNESATFITGIRFTRARDCLSVNTHPQVGGRYTDTQLSQKRSGRRSSQSFGEGIGKLGGRRHKQKGYKTIQQFFTKEMVIKLNMLGSFVKNWVFCYMNRCLAVTMKRNWKRRQHRETVEKANNPGEFCNKATHRTLFGFSRREFNHWLFLGFP